MKRVTRGLFCIVIYLTSVPGYANTLMDLILLEDGREYLGYVISQVPNDHVLLKQMDGSVVFLQDYDIVSLDKVMSSSYEREFDDLVFTNNGTYYRGRIVKTVPAVSLTIDMRSGVTLQLPWESISRIVAEPIATERSHISPGQTVESVAADIQIEIQLGRLLQAVTSAGAGSDIIDHLSNDLVSSKVARDVVLRGMALNQAQYELDALDTLSASMIENTVSLSEFAEPCAGMEVTRSKGDRLPALNEIGVIETGLHDSDLSTLVEESEYSVGRTVGIASLPLGDLAIVDEINARIQTREDISSILNEEKKISSRTAYKVKRLSRDLPENDRRLLYLTHQREDELRAATLNAIPFFALGSISQRDWGYALPSIGASGVAALIFVAFTTVPLYGGYQTVVTETGIYNVPVMNRITIGAASVIGGVAVMNLIEPFLYSRRQNRKLADALDLQLKDIQ